jgi:glycerate kinase
MKIVVATDSFKGSMRSDEAGSIIADALRESLQNAEITMIPVADGGEGTTDAVVRATGGELKPVQVTGPLGDRVTAHYGVLPDGETAVMEMASASGIELVPTDQLDPMKASTYGTGMAQALGYRLLDADGNECGRGGEALETIARIDGEEILPALLDSRIRVASDVSNPLLGEQGTARIFGPQKGATPEMIELLEKGLAGLARVWIDQRFLDDVERPGDGAAGGLGAGLRAFCNAEMSSGANLVADIIGFDREVQNAHLLVTGEGRTDEQTAGGKLCAVLAAKAKAAGASTILISGGLHGDIENLGGFFDAVFAAVQDVSSIDEAIARGPENLSVTARSVGRVLALGQDLSEVK